MYEMKSKIPWVLAVILIFLITLCGILTIAETKAEDLPEAPLPSISIDSLYKIVSATISKSEEPFDMQVVECIRIDISLDELPDQVTQVEAELFFPALPTNIKSVVLSDRYRAFPANWHWTDQDVIFVSFNLSDVQLFHDLQGLYLFLLAW